MNWKKSARAFTLTEIMAVVVVAGILALFIIPNYDKSIKRGEERDAAFKLSSIRAGQDIYKTFHNMYSPDLSDLSMINSFLGLNIPANAFTFNCGGGNMNAFDCRAVSPYGWTLQVSDTNPLPHCFSGTCPSCSTTTCPFN